MDMKEIQATATEMQKQSTMAYAEGVRYALDYLREVYGVGIEYTSIWAEYMQHEHTMIHTSIGEPAQCYDCGKKEEAK